MLGSGPVGHPLRTTNRQVGPSAAQRLTYTVAKQQQLLHEDCCQTTQNLADEIRIGYGTWQLIVTGELDVHHVAAKFVPRILTADQKQHHVNICEELHQIASDDAPFLSRVITGDES
jgi:hypothetical protein